jgi:hypothetical protein
VRRLRDGFETTFLKKREKTTSRREKTTSKQEKTTSPLSRLSSKKTRLYLEALRDDFRRAIPEVKINA